MKRMRVALAGAGMVSAHHLIAWSRCADANVVAIADPDLDRARSRASEFGIGATFDDAARMLDATRPDALDIAASHASHAALCDLAADRGVAILCQKPLALTLDAARRIATSVGNRVRLMVHENWRHRPYYRQARAWIAEGRIGNVRHVAISAKGSGLVAQKGVTAAALTRQPMLAGLERLAIGEVLVHHLDVACWLAGPLAMVASRIRRDVTGVRGESAASMLLEGSDGCTAIVDGDMAVPGASATLEDRLEVVGSAGSIRLDRAQLVLVVAAGVRTSFDYDLDDAYQRSYDGAIAHFAQALMDDAPFETPPDVHLRVLALVEDAYRLANQHRAAVQTKPRS